MKTARGVIMLLVLAPMLAMAQAALGSFQEIETETFDKEDFVFPDDMRGTRLNIVFLAMSEDQDNGQLQGEVLKEWQTALDERQVFSAEVVGYHFAVIKAPFFVKGIIRNAMREDFEGRIELNQSGILFVKNLQKFADAAGIPVDDQPTVIVAAPDGKLIKVIDGQPTEQAVNELVEAISGAASDSPGV